jgi:hypothetical protein
MSFFVYKSGIFHLLEYKSTYHIQEVIKSDNIFFMNKGFLVLLTLNIILKLINRKTKFLKILYSALNTFVRDLNKNKNYI